MRYIFIVFILLSGCSAKWHLKKAIQKGARLDRDTVTVTLRLPGDTVKIEVPASLLDTVDFFATMEEADSLLLAKERLETSLAINENLSADLQAINKERDRLKLKLLNGFYKDSTFSIQVDERTRLVLTLQGILKRLEIHTADTTINTSVPCPQPSIQTGFSWIHLALSFLLGILITVLIFKLLK